MTTANSAPSHVSRTATIHLAAPMDRVFPLFTVPGEKHWAEGWNPQMIYPASGQPEMGAVFTTQHPGEGLMTWIITQYEPASGQISYARFAPEGHAGLISVQCQASADGHTAATITYTLT